MLGSSRMVCYLAMFVKRTAANQIQRVELAVSVEWEYVEADVHHIV
jgi:hypothetical protein